LRYLTEVAQPIPTEHADKWTPSAG
jgi:hypothetical protein